jgi:hypothetical protein
MPTCTVIDCTQPSRRRGLCNKHSFRLYKHGDPEVSLYIVSGVEERLEQYIQATDDPEECHLWTRGCNAAGYGCVSADGSWRLVTRVVMEILLGRPLLTEEHVLHTCDNPPCCNPHHLYLGDPEQNARDRKERRRHWRDRLPPKTHCKRGHEYTEENTYWTRTGRSCRKCRTIARQKWDNKNRRKKAVQ